MTSASRRKEFLIETDELHQLLLQQEDSSLKQDGSLPALRLVHASLIPPQSAVNALALHERQRLTKETQLYEVNKIVDPYSSLPNTLPTTATFIEHMRRLKIRRTDRIVCYDIQGMGVVARAAWMLRFFGATDVRIMNGGLLKWLREGRQIYSGPYTEGEGLFSDDARTNSNLDDYNYKAKDKDSKVVKDVEVMKHVAYYLANKATDWQVIDTRPSHVFFAEDKHDQSGGWSGGLRQGHIKGAKNVPLSEYLDSKTGCLKENNELVKLMLKHNIDTTVPTVNMCNSGVTACVSDLTMRILGGVHQQLYDGSWQEYGRTEEPDFMHGNKHGWDEPINESVDRYLESLGPEKYQKYLSEKKLNTKLRQMEHDKRLKEDDLIEKTRGMPLDYRYYSTEDEEVSDYELDAEDLHPKSNPPK